MEGGNTFTSQFAGEGYTDNLVTSISEPCAFALG